MSHLVSVDVEFKDLDALKQACEAIGLEFMHGQTTFQWYGRWVGDTQPPEWMDPETYGTCDHAIRVKPGTELANNRKAESAYEIGVIDMGNGTYRLAVDEYMKGFGLMQVAGDGLDKLVSEYTMQVAVAQCEQLGWMSERSAEGLTVYHPSGGELRVSTAGQVDALGFQGVGCAEAVRSIAGAIGEETDVVVKQEFNEAQQIIRRTDS